MGKVLQSKSQKRKMSRSHGLAGVLELGQTEYVYILNLLILIVYMDKATGYASDELDDPEEESPAKKRKNTKGRASAAAKAKAKKKAKEDGDYEGSSEDEYKAVSKNLWSMGGNGGPKPPAGSFEKCARCEKQFTVVCSLFLRIRKEFDMTLSTDKVYYGS